MENKRIKEWKWKSRKLVGNHREGQDKEKGGKDEDRQIKAKGGEEIERGGNKSLYQFDVFQHE